MKLPTPALALLAALALPHVWAQTPAATPAAPAASAPAGDTVRAEMGAPLQAAQDALKAGDTATTLAKLAQADALPNATPYEAYLIARLRASVYLKTGELGPATTALEAVLVSPKLPQADRALMLQALADATYRNKQYPAAAKWAQQYFDAGGNSVDLRVLLGQALYLNKDYAAASEQLAQVLKAEDAAGKVPQERVLRLLASSANERQDKAAYQAMLERLVAHYPNPEYWADLLARVERRPGFAERLTLDALRLRRALGLMGEAGDYEDMTQLLNRAGYPIEAQRVLEEGFSKGKLGSGANAAEHRKLRDSLAKTAADDRKEMERADTTGARVRDGDSLVKLGYVLASIGQAEKGIELMERGLARSDVKRPDDARLLLGATQWNAAQKDKAVATFKGVTGSDGAADLARLWLLHAAKK